MTMVISGFRRLFNKLAWLTAAVMIAEQFPAERNLPLSHGKTCLQIRMSIKYEYGTDWNVSKSVREHMLRDSLALRWL